jgi:biotin carboxyl carrier protein
MADEQAESRRPAGKRPRRDRQTADRSAEARLADHAAIDQLAGDLLPSLVAKLAESGLGEIEIREGSWRVRIRRPTDGPALARRAADRASRAQPGHAGHGHPPAGFEGHRSTREPRESRSAASQTNGSTPAGLVPVGPGAERPAPGGPADDGDRVVATSPAVGVYQPRPDARSGSHVRAGDRLGAVDMLGIAQEVVAPIDGIVGESLVEAGQAVEYGQELVVIEPADEATARDARGSRPNREA